MFVCMGISCATQSNTKLSCLDCGLCAWRYLVPLCSMRHCLVDIGVCVHGQSLRHYALCAIVSSRLMFVYIKSSCATLSYPLLSRRDWGLCAWRALASIRHVLYYLVQLRVCVHGQLLHFSIIYDIVSSRLVFVSMKSSCATMSYAPSYRQDWCLWVWRPLVPLCLMLYCLV